MTRHRPQSAVRVLGHCARCGVGVRNGLARRETAFLAVGASLTRHELDVCRDCDSQHTSHPTEMERDALARDPASAVEAMEFAQTWSAELRRVQRTAVHFLGAANVERLRVELRAAYVEQRDRVDASYEPYRQRTAERAFVPLDDVDDDDDLPFEGA